MSVQLLQGDCLVLLPTLADASIDAIVTDPPYELGFMGRAWDRTGIAYNVALWQECYRVLKPGGHLVAFGGTRTYHRMTVAIEDAGFEIRDMLTWLYAQGFPKSLDISKALDKAAGAEREVVGTAADFALDGAKRDAARHRDTRQVTGFAGDTAHGWDRPITAPATDLAQQWAGWGTALKPAHEPICLARKPLIGTVAANVQAYGTGALHIDAARIPGALEGDPHRFAKTDGGAFVSFSTAPVVRAAGRWPANLILSHAPDCNGVCVPGCPVAALDAQSGERKSGAHVRHSRGNEASGNSHTAYGRFGPVERAGYDETGGASRFFPVFQPDNELDTCEHVVYNETGGTPTWASQDRNPSTLAASDTLPQRAITGSISGTLPPSQAELCLNTSGCGSKPTDPSRPDTKSTTGTATSRTTDSTTLNLWTPPPTSDSTAGASCATACGGNPANSAANSSPLTPNTGMSAPPDTPCITDAAPVTSARSLPINSDGARFLFQAKASRSERNRGCEGLDGGNGHCTVKPVALCRWLLTLVVPPGGVALDPFMGSGSIGVAAVEAGVGYIGIERESDYLDIARARCAAAQAAPVQAPLPERIPA